MTNIALASLGFTSRRLANWIRIVAIAFTFGALLALSFVLGRTTMGDSGHSTPDVRPAIVAPANPPSVQAPVCQLRGPC
jgi:hypothetical protein